MALRPRAARSAELLGGSHKFIHTNCLQFSKCLSCAPQARPLILALRRQRRMDPCELEAILVCIVSFRPVKTTQRDPVSKMRYNTQFEETIRVRRQRLLKLSDQELKTNPTVGYMLKTLLEENKYVKIDD